MNDKKKKVNRFIEGRESVLVYSGLILAFLVIIGFFVSIYLNTLEKIKLELKFDSEKSFNSVYMALNDSYQKALRTMNEEGVSGVAIYNTNGKMFLSLGDAPVTLPLNELVKSRQTGEDSTLGLFVINEDDRQIEYFRLSRLNVLLETGDSDFVRRLSLGISQGTADYPEILYVKFDGSRYFKSLSKIRLEMMFVLFGLIIIFFLIVRTYRNNKKFKDEIDKNKSLAKLGAAARTLTHEIKNPLSAMTIQSALMRKTLPAEFSGDLDVMDHEIERLTMLTNRVSEFLRNPLGNPSVIEIVSFITDISKLFKTPVGLEFHGRTKVYTKFDKDRARSVFENLIKNATESCQNRDPQVLVDVNTPKKGIVRIRVMDRGDGLPDDIKQKIYDPFFTTKIHGSGIGLAISKQFIEAENGSIKLYNRDGGGTVAEVTLRVCQEEE